MATRGGAGRRRSRIRPSPAEEDFVRYDVDERSKYGEDETEFKQHIVLRATNTSYRS